MLERPARAAEDGAAAAGSGAGLPPVPLRAPRSSWRGWVWRLAPPLLLLLLAAVNALAHDRLLAAIDQVLPGCLFRWWTGLSCPGCGGTRAFKALLEGQVWAALRYNVFGLPTLLVLAEEYLLSWWLWLHPEQEVLRYARSRLLLLKGYAWLVLVWFVMRNVCGI